MTKFDITDDEFIEQEPKRDSALFLDDEFEDIPDPDVVTPAYDKPDPKVATPRRRAKGADDYSKKIHSINRAIFVARWNKAQSNHSSKAAADAAAIAMYGKNVETTLGDLAAHDARIGNAIDWLTEGAENPYLSAIAACVPLAMQLLRNHEQDVEPQSRGIRVPFTKNKRVLRFKFGVKLSGIHPFTHEPESFTAYVLSDPELRKSMERMGLVVN